jgi:hypothetical protein
MTRTPVTTRPPPRSRSSPGSAPVRARVPPTPLEEMLLSTTLGSVEVEALESLTLGEVDVLTDVDDTLLSVVDVDVDDNDDDDEEVSVVEVDDVDDVELDETVPSTLESAAGIWSFIAAWAEAPSPTKMTPVASRVTATLRDAKRIGGIPSFLRPVELRMVAAGP